MFHVEQRDFLFHVKHLWIVPRGTSSYSRSDWFLEPIRSERFSESGILDDARQVHSAFLTIFAPSSSPIQ